MKDPASSTLLIDEMLLFICVSVTSSVSVCVCACHAVNGCVCLCLRVQ